MSIDIMIDDHQVHVMVPHRLLTAFTKVVKDGMAFERGQPPELYAFNDHLLELEQANRLSLSEAQRVDLSSPPEC